MEKQKPTHLFLMNPAAGKRMDTEKLCREIQSLMQGRGEDWELVQTSAPGDGERLARQWAEQSRGPLRIYALGGDGTLNEVVNGAAGFSHVAVGCCPLGSGNDFVKSFSRPEAFRELSALIQGEAWELDLIECNGRLSINVASVGFDARISRDMQKYKGLPLVKGGGAYIISLLVNLVKGIHRPYQVELDGKTLQGDFTLICACNGQWYGGSFHPAPQACLHDGLLDFLLVKGCSRLTVAGLVNKYAQGRAREFPELIHTHRGKEISIRCDRPSVINLDGESIWARELVFKLSEKRLHFLLPPGVEPPGATS